MALAEGTLTFLVANSRSKTRGALFLPTFLVVIVLLYCEKSKSKITKVSFGLLEALAWHDFCHKAFMHGEFFARDFVLRAKALGLRP